jgi:protein-tyrosine phosphatase
LEIRDLIDTVLVVCVGNVCRSPVATQLLAAGLASEGSRIRVSSAGIGAMVGQEIDPVAAEIAQANGLSLQAHTARQFTPEMGMDCNLLLVMETGHRKHILQKSPQLLGRIMLFDHWTGARGISDPYKQSREFHEIVFARLNDAANAWVKKLTIVKGASA